MMRSAIRQILFRDRDTLSFDLPLLTSLVPRFALGSYTSTFTRATTATVTDFEGLFKTAKAGEARFEGARRVENLLSFSEDFSNAVWTLGGTATKTGTQIVNLPAITDRILNSVITSNIANRKYIASCTLSGSGTVSIRVSNNVDYAPLQQVTLSEIPTRFSATFTMNGTTSTIISVQLYRDTGNTATQVACNNFQLEDVTGQTNQNPSEYVSTGVLSAPYHGCSVDGVKYFDTYNGNTVASNVVTEATGAGIPDTTLKGYLAEGSRINLLLNSATPVTQNVTVTAQAYTVSMWGTGTCTLSGTGSGVLTGTGATDRVQLTLTPTAGTLTLTFAGTNTNGQLEAGAFASSYIPTAAASVTRNADVLTYPTAGNFLDATGSAYAEAESKSWANATMQVIGDGTESPLKLSSANSGVQAFDGTNTASGAAGTPSGKVKMASKWSESQMKVFANGVAGGEATYDGAFTLASIGVGAGTVGSATIRNVKIWKKVLKDSKLIKLTS